MKATRFAQESAEQAEAERAMKCETMNLTAIGIKAHIDGLRSENYRLKQRVVQLELLLKKHGVVNFP